MSDEIESSHSKGDKVFMSVLLGVVACFLVFWIYWIANSLNPDSRFCLYKIYQQKDGTYEVWWECRFRHLEKSGLTYESAKALQIECCQSIKDCESRKPKGHRVP